MTRSTLLAVTLIAVALSLQAGDGGSECENACREAAQAAYDECMAKGEGGDACEAVYREVFEHCMSENCEGEPPPEGNLLLGGERGGVLASRSAPPEDCQASRREAL